MIMTSVKNLNPIISFKKLEKIILDDAQGGSSLLSEILRNFKAIFCNKYDFKIINKKFLKKIEEAQFEKIKNDIFRDVKLFLIKPLCKMIKFFFKSILSPELLSSLELSDKTKMKFTILNIAHKITFKFCPMIYQVIMMFIKQTKKPERIKLKSQQLSLTKYKFIESFDVERVFSFNTNTQNTQSTTAFTGKDLYLNAIDKVNFIQKGINPLKKLDIISSIHQKIWGSILRSYESTDTKAFNELRVKLDADNLLSLYSYVIFNSKNHHLHTEIAFIEEFIDEKILNNYEHLYYFEMFKSALEYITNHISEN